MSSVNLCVFTGRLGKRPEIKYTNSGTAVMALDLCVVDRVKNGDQWQDKTNWIKAIIYGKRAEFFNFLDKGSLVTIQSRLSTRSYQDKQGKTVYVTEFIADHVVADKPSQSQPEQKESSQPEFNTTTPIEDDLPF